MSKGTILLDGKGIDKVLERVIKDAAILVTVDHGLESAYRVGKVPERAYVGPGVEPGPAQDWVGFSGGTVESFGSGDGIDGLGHALEWTLGSGRFSGVDLVGLFTGEPLVDHGRLLTMVEYAIHGIPIQVLESHHRWCLVEGEFTLNAKPGSTYSILPLGGGVDLEIKTGKRDICHKALTGGSTALIGLKTWRDVTSIRVEKGQVLVRIPR